MPKIDSLDEMVHRTCFLPNAYLMKAVCPQPRHKTTPSHDWRSMASATSHLENWTFRCAWLTCVCLNKITVLVDFSPQERREIFGNHRHLSYLLGLFQTFFFRVFPHLLTKGYQQWRLHFGHFLHLRLGMSVLSTALQGNLLNSRLGCAPVQWAGFLKQSLGRLMFCFLTERFLLKKISKKQQWWWSPKWCVLKSQIVTVS